ncbi:MAG: hypothetical protein ACK56W_24465 [Pirellula sp.]|jgi:hypothetical protein|nr:hypothetical protein [Pirellula sp.]
MIEIIELANDHERHCAEFWKGNEMVQVEGYGDHHYLSTRPLRIHVKPKQFGEMIWSSWPIQLFVSQRLHEVFQHAGISGYEALAADVKLIFDHRPEERVFWQVGVTGWGGIARPESGLKCVDDRSFPRRFTKSKGTGPVFDPGQWDGSDFFVVWPHSACFVSSKVLEILEREEVCHFRSQSPNMYCHFENDQEFTGSPLQCWFREDRAREIGQPLGLYWTKEEQV